MVRPERFERPTYWFVARSKKNQQIMRVQQVTASPESTTLLILVETAYIREALAGAISTTLSFPLSEAAGFRRTLRRRETTRDLRRGLIVIDTSLPRSSRNCISFSMENLLSRPHSKAETFG